MTKHGMSGREPGGRTTEAKAPWFARALLSLAMRGEDRRFALADLEEEFEERVERLGGWSARRWYRAQVMRSLPHAVRGRLVRRGARGSSKTSMNGEGMMKGRMQNILTDLRLATRSLRA